MHFFSYSRNQLRKLALGVVLICSCISSGNVQARNIKPTTLVAPTTGNSFSPTRVVVFSPDGNALATAGDDGLIHIWDLKKKKLRRVLAGKSGKIVDLCYSKNGKWLVDASTACTNLWDTKTGRLVRRFKVTWNKIPDEFYSVAFSPDDKSIATGSGGNGFGGIGHPFRVILWDVASGKLRKVFQGNRGKIQSVGFSIDGRSLFGASYDGTLRTWNVKTGKLTTTQDFKTPVLTAISSPDGTKMAVSTENGKAEIHNFATANVLKSLSGNFEPIKTIAFFPNNQQLVGGSSDGSVSIWMVSTGRRVHLLNSQSSQLHITGLQRIRDDIVSVAVSPDGALIASASFAGWIQLWQLG